MIRWDVHWLCGRKTYLYYDRGLYLYVVRTSSEATHTVRSITVSSLLRIVFFSLRFVSPKSCVALLEPKKSVMCSIAPSIRKESITDYSLGIADAAELRYRVVLKQ
jgi:hypothetical protein